MPYLITTKPPYDGHAEVRIEPRRAVATLDEAREAAWHAFRDDHDCTLCKYQAFALTEEGGTVGPLPDGTIIEVRHAPGRDGWRQLAAATKRVYATGGEREILDAYNAVSEGSR